MGHAKELCGVANDWWRAVVRREVVRQLPLAVFRMHQTRILMLLLTYAARNGIAAVLVTGAAIVLIGRYAAGGSEDQQRDDLKRGDVHLRILR